MFEKYKTLVLNFYLEMKEKGFLSSDMENPGRDKLKHECLLTFSKKNSKKDRDLIQMFFDPTNEYNDPIRSIERYDLDKFRPLVAFLKREQNVRGDKNVKLLAWLLDCPSYEDWRNGAVFPTIKGKKPGDPPPPLPPPPPPPLKVNNIIFKISISFIILFIVSIAYAFWKKNKDKAIREATPTEQCMYWTGQHYEPIACNDKDANKLKIPLNKEQLANQQKITLPDTLTNWSIGKVWYARTKINGKRDFYTDSGTNPLDTTKRLLPLTDYILTRYISYDRYLLNILTWSVSLVALFSLLSIMAYRYRPKNPA
ncbi:hypothetical protein [Pedobacter rhodius]|uniref:Uncharacterized protein n=1 Tax=Pedobacter rhodius TaxID=3004098 RepID=A0ABT4L1C3_9SPHI|nr:hypothetical protein [Pedobacter sp. SJ11]MCZ4224970.1 hypothetical protein [Pedobacter sp. SJ11]